MVLPSWADLSTESSRADINSASPSKTASRVGYPVGIVTIGMLVLGLGALHLSHTRRFRTVAAAIAAAPATGGIVAIEIFIVWAVNQIV